MLPANFFSGKARRSYAIGCFAPVPVRGRMGQDGRPPTRRKWPPQLAYASRMASDRLSARRLNRALLARQLLLERNDSPILDTVRHLVGLQAQEPLDPYTALWSRLDSFDPDDLGKLLIDRKVVRIVAMRATVHLLAADDCLELRPMMQEVLDKELRLHQQHRSHLAGLDLAPVISHARELLAEHPRTMSSLREELGTAFPDLNAAALAYAMRNHLPLVQIPPRGVWGQSSQVRYANAEDWLGRPASDTPSPEQMVLRYLAAFGPAAAADVAAWSRLTGMRDVIEQVQPQLQTFTDDRGRTLVDLPDAPRPDADTPAPPRFLPQFDNVLLSHKDRTRIISDDDRPIANEIAPFKGHVLYDGFWTGVWSIDRDGAAAILTIEHARPLTAPAEQEIGEEGTALLHLHAPDAENREVRFVRAAP